MTNTVKAHQEHGFTLVEVLAVLTIISALFVISVPLFSAQRGRALDTSVQAAGKSTADALSSWSVFASTGETATLAAARANGASAQSGITTVITGSASSWCVSTYAANARTYRDVASALTLTSDGKPCAAGNPYASGIYNAAGTGFIKDATGTALDTYALNARGTADEQAFSAVTAEQNSLWLADPNLANTAARITAYAQMAKSAGKTGTVVLYRLPGRDICAGQSAGGAVDYSSYQVWIANVAAALSASGAAPSLSVVIEPDSLADNCAAARQAMPLRTATLASVVTQMNAAGVGATYLDAGNSGYAPVSVIAPRLVAAGVAQARGFSTNISNYKNTTPEVAFAEQVRAALGSAAPDAHYIVDVSRNGGAPVAGVWCNNSGAGLGAAPAIGSGFLDATLRIKTTGTSDGSDAALCGSGSPAAGSWHPAFARSLFAHRAA